MQGSPLKGLMRLYPLAGHIRAVLDEHAKDFHNFVL